MAPTQKIKEIEDQVAQVDTQVQLIDEVNIENTKSPILKFLIIGLGVFLVFAFSITWIITSAPEETYNSAITILKNIFNEKLFLFMFIGLLAQIVDGALGMAYGATASTFLLSFGISPALSSASIHIAEVFTTGASGLSHLKFGNVNKKLFKNLLIPGMIGAVIGAALLCYFDSQPDSFIKNYVKPATAIYLMFLGIIVLRKALMKIQPKRKIKQVAPLAILGGFMDSVGGGGWGPIVTSTLVSSGRSVNYTIGSVNLAEFFVATASSITFVFFVGIESGLWQVIVGLIIGGVFAAPFAAFLVTKVKRKPLMISVGVLIILLSLRTLFKTFF